ncbi:MAG: pyridoxal-phosphate dependent enzyme, partial [Gammaproteobacteria bacterium]|nr:pyridoxal-phosphate dependent enzyme [Gammaproteobacteria bacterium]
MVRFSPPDLDTIRRTAERLEPYIFRTPVVTYPCELPELNDVHLQVKLELLQVTGSFKPRGAINNVMHGHELQRGITAFSAGNHAIAAAYAARIHQIPATVVMPRSANSFRVNQCLQQGAQIEYGEDIAALLAIVERLQHNHGMTLVHPFEGEHTAAGTATLGLE